MRDEWYVARRGPDGNKRYGPVPLQQLRELVDTGKVQPGDLIWREGMAVWQRADQCETLFPAPPPLGPSRDPRDRPSDDRRGYRDGPAGRPRGRYQDDDRPNPRRYPQQQSSGGWIIALVVGGVAVLCLAVCGGLAAFGLYSARSAPMMTTSVKSSVSKQAFPPPVAAVGDNGDTLPPGFGGPRAGLGKRLAFRTSELYYTDTIRQDEAQQLGDYLDGQGVFPENHAVTVQLANPVGTYQVRFCVKAGMAWNQDVADFYRDLRDDIGANVFPGMNVEVHLCDENMTTMRTLRAGD